jgi:hypothetical protein
MADVLETRCGGQGSGVARNLGRATRVPRRQWVTWPVMDTAMPSPVRLICISLGAILVARPALLISSSTSSPLWGHIDVSARPESSALRSSEGASFTQGVTRTSPKKAPGTSTWICRGAFFSAQETSRIVARAQKNAQLGSVQFVDSRGRLRGAPALRGLKPRNFAFTKKKVRAVGESKDTGPNRQGSKGLALLAMFESVPRVRPSVCSHKNTGEVGPPVAASLGGSPAARLVPWASQHWQGRILCEGAVG